MTARVLKLQLSNDSGNQHVSGYSSPDLLFDSIFADGQKFYVNVKKLELIRRQTRFYDQQRLAPGQLDKRHDAKQLGTTERAHPGITLMALASQG